MPERSMEISVIAAARIVGCSPDAVLCWIEEGASTARRISRRGWWKIERKSLIRYLDRQAGKEEFENAANPRSRFARGA